MSCHDPHRPTFSHAVDKMREEKEAPQGNAPPVEWPLFYLTAATFFLLGALVVFIAYEIGNCV